MTPSPASQPGSPDDPARTGQRRYDVQPWRKVAYYGGAVLSIVGLGMFGYVFVSAFLGFNDPGGPAVVVPRMFRIFPLAFIGIILSGIGQWIRSLGRAGLSGSGLLLSPEGEVRDAEPWDRAEGARTQHRLEEVPGLAGLGAGDRRPPEVRIRCRACGYLETEDARFCSACGQPV